MTGFAASLKKTVTWRSSPPVKLRSGFERSELFAPRDREEPPWAAFSAPRLLAPPSLAQRKAAPDAAERAAPAAEKSGCACGNTGASADPCPGCSRVLAGASSTTRDGAEAQADAIGADIGARLGTESVGSGRLGDRVRAVAETHLGVDLAGTELRTDGAADNRARALGAIAVTEGSRISFASGRLSTTSRDGRELLGHELVHVAQQRTAGVPAVQRQVDRGAGGGGGAGGATAAGTGGTGGVRARNEGGARGAGGGPAADKLPEQFAPSSSASDPARLSDEELLRLGHLAEKVPEVGERLGEYRDEAAKRAEAAEKRGDALLAQRFSELVVFLEDLASRDRCICGSAPLFSPDAFAFVHGVRREILAASAARGVPPLAVAGAIADEYNARRRFGGALDALQDAVIDALPESFIDVDRFFDIRAKLLNALENDVGPANIKVRTALELVQSGSLKVPGSPIDDVKVQKIVDFLLTPVGTVEATAAVIAEAAGLFGPFIGNHPEPSQEALFVNYFKAGRSFFDRFKARVDANPKHFACPGPEGCTFLRNRSRLFTALFGSGR